MKNIIRLLLLLNSFVFFIIQTILLFKTFPFFSEKVGSFFTVVIFIIGCNVLPFIYIIWHWISNGIPTTFIFHWGASIAIMFLSIFLYFKLKS